ncbi:type II toxin-antitoxin system RelE/ParE family toxin [Massilia sp. SR12]
MKRVRFLTGARAEFGAGLAYYGQLQPPRASDFRKAVEQAAALALAFPDAGQVAMGARKIVVRHFPHNLIYQQEIDGVLIVALSHQSRRPGYWIDRI